MISAHFEVILERILCMLFLALLQNSLDQEITNPSWRLSFPYVLVATISSFLFGYHLGFVHFLRLAFWYFSSC